jgi:hypothetical protein
MFWRMVQSGLQRWSTGQSGCYFVRTIWVSDGSAAHDLLKQRSAVYPDGTAFIAGSVNLSCYLPSRKSLTLCGSTSLIFRVGLRFEEKFYAPPTVSLTGMIRYVGLKRLNERRISTVASNITTETCDIAIDIGRGNHAMDGLFVNWTAVGPSARLSGPTVR